MFAVVDVFQGDEIAFEILGVVIPTVDPPLAGEVLSLLHFRRPHGIVRPGVAVTGRVDRAEGDIGFTEGVAPAGHRVGSAVPARVHGEVAVLVLGGIAIRVELIAEYVAAVIEDDVQDDADAVRMSGIHQVDEILAGAEVRVDIEEILDAVAMVGVGVRGHLLEHRADPDGRHTEALEVADLVLQSLQRATQPLVAGVGPGGPVRRVGVVGEAEWRRAAAGIQISRVIAEALLASIGEAIEHQEIKHLVFPGGWRRCVAGPTQGGPVDVMQTAFELIMAGVVDGHFLSPLKTVDHGSPGLPLPGVVSLSVASLSGVPGEQGISASQRNA